MNGATRRGMKDARRVSSVFARCRALSRRDSPVDDQPQKFVIQRASESKSEWWTGSGWSEDEADALFFDVEPMANSVTGDESATVYRQEIGKQRSARYAMSQC